MPTTFQGQSLTALDITLTSTVILRELLRYSERLLAHRHPATVTAAWHFMLCITLKLCFSPGCMMNPNPQHCLEQSPSGQVPRSAGRTPAAQSLQP